MNFKSIYLLCQDGLKASKYNIEIFDLDKPSVFTISKQINYEKTNGIGSQQFRVSGFVKFATITNDLT